MRTDPTAPPWSPGWPPTTAAESTGRTRPPPRSRCSRKRSLPRDAMFVVEQLRACVHGLNRACDSLQDPTPVSLDFCSSVLQGAVETLSALQPELSGGDPE